MSTRRRPVQVAVVAVCAVIAVACGQKAGVHVAGAGGVSGGGNGAVVDQNGQLVNPETGQPIEGANGSRRPPTMTCPSSMGMIVG